MNQKEEGLKRELGVFGLSANIVNIIVGAGIFVIPAIVACKNTTNEVIVENNKSEIKTEKPKAYGGH